MGTATDKDMLSWGYNQGEINAYRMQQNRELLGYVPKIDLDNEAGRMSTDSLKVNYESITPIKNGGITAVKIENENVTVDFDVDPVIDGTTPFGKFQVIHSDGTTTKKQLATYVQAKRWEERENFKERYETLLSMPLHEAEQRLIEIFGDKKNAIKNVMFGLQAGFNAEEMKERLSLAKTQHGKDVITTATGKKVSEISRTVFVKEKWMNASSIQNGVQLSEDQVIQGILSGDITPTGEYEKFKDAEAAAIDRSKKIQIIKKIDTNVQLTNTDFDLTDNKVEVSKKRIDLIGWENGQPVFSASPRYAIIADDEYQDSLATAAMAFTNKIHIINEEGQIVEQNAEVIDLTFTEMMELSYQQSIIGKVGLIQDCADDQSKCAIMVEDFYKKTKSIVDTDWYERLASGAMTFGLDSPVYYSSCLFGGGFAAALAAPAAGAASLAATPVAGAAIEAAAFGTGCWTMSLATHGAVTSILDDILESFVWETNLDGVEVFINAVKEFGAQAVIGFLVSKVGYGAKSLTEMIPHLAKMTRGIAAPAIEVTAQGATLAQGEHLWQKAQGNTPDWIVDRQGLMDSVIFLAGFRVVHSSSSSMRQTWKNMQNVSAKFIEKRLIYIQKKYSIPHEVIKNYVETHPTLAQEIIDQLSEVPKIVDGKPIWTIPDMVRDMLLSISAHHAKSTSKVTFDGDVMENSTYVRLTTSKLEEINGKLVRRYIIQQNNKDGTENRTEIIFEPVGNGKLKLIDIRGTVDPKVILEIVKNDNRSITEVSEKFEDFKLEKDTDVDTDLSEVDVAVEAIKLEIDDLTAAIERLDPKMAEEIKVIVKEAAEGTFGKEQIQESIDRLDTYTKQQVIKHVQASLQNKKDVSVEYRQKTGLHTVDYLESINIIGDMLIPVNTLKIPDMKVIREGEVGEHYFLAEHTSHNSNLTNIEKGFNALIHVGDTKQTSAEIEKNPNKTPYKILVKTVNPLMKNGEILQIDLPFGDAKYSVQIAKVLKDAGIITEADYVKVTRPNEKGSDNALNEIMRDIEIDSIYYQNKEGDVSVIALPENIRVLHKITKTSGTGESIESRNYNLSDPENGAISIALPELVAIAKGLLDGKYPLVLKFLGEGVRGRARTGKEKSEIEILAVLGKDVNELVRVLAHEIGHISDAAIKHELLTGEITTILGRVINLKGNVLEHFDSLIKGKGLSNKEIHIELYNLSKEWRPFDEAKADAEFLLYRNDPAELYADFVSAFLVNPTWAKKTAPNAYESFMIFIEGNPKFKRNYEKIQDDIALQGSSNAVLRQGIRDDFVEGAEVREEQSNVARTKDWTLYGFLDKAHGIVRDVKKGKKAGFVVPDSKNPIYKYRDYLYKNSIAELYLDTISVRVMSPIRMGGASEIDFGEYLLYQRIAKGDRIDIISTRGITKEKATELLLELDTRFPQLKDLVEEYWTLRQSTVLDFLERSDALDPVLKRKIIENRYYATVNVIEHLNKANGQGTGLKFYGQIGTFKAQENPLLATIESDMLLLNGLLKNAAERSAIEFYLDSKKAVPDLFVIEKAKTEAVVTDFGTIRRPIKPEDPELGLITAMFKGKVKGFYVDKFSAKAYETNVGELQFILRNTFLVNNYFREIYTIANPGFIMVTNPLRDIHRLVLNLPDRKRDMIPYYKDVSMLLQTLTYGIPEGVKRVSGKGSARVDKMRRELSLISVAEPWGEHEGKDPLTGMLHRYHGINNKNWNELVKHPFNKSMRRIHDLNAIMETATKVVADRHLEKYFPNMSAEKRIDIIRTQAGSPAHLVRGAASVFYNNISLFSNAMEQGYRGDWQAAKGRYGMWSYHAIKSGILPKVVMIMMAKGYVFPGQSLEDAKINATIMAMVPDRIKTNYIVIPIGLRRVGSEENGNPIYKGRVLIKPVDETSRLLGGITHRLLSQQYDLPMSGPSGVGSFMGGEVPQMTPVVEIFNNVLEYLSGEGNPIDGYTGTPIISNDKYKAGMGDAEFYDWLWRNLGGSIFLENNPMVDLTSPKDLVEDDTEYIILSGISKRFIREYDSRDVPFAYADTISTIKARQKVVLEMAIIKSIDKRDLNEEEMNALISTDGAKLSRKIKQIIRKGTASAWTRQYLAGDKEQQIFMFGMAWRLYEETGNLMARQFMEGIMQGDPNDFSNLKLYPGYKKMLENMQEQ